MQKRSSYEPSDKMFQPTLTSMRQTAYGRGMVDHINKVLTEDRSKDGDRIEAAQAKQERKAAKRKEHVNGKANSK